jgi:hypothetical protein
MWLSGLNRATGSVMGHASAQAARQYQAMMTEGARQMVKLWTGSLIAPPAAKKRARRKRKTKR